MIRCIASCRPRAASATCRRRSRGTVRRAARTSRALVRWTERYRYDAASNLIRVQHQANGGSFVRDLALVPASNRLAAMTVGQSVFNYIHDPNGNLLGEAASRHFEWDHNNRIRAFRIQAGTAEPSVHAHYLYDAGGQRVKKIIRKQGGQFATTVYIEGIFEHHRTVQRDATVENNTLHVMDNQSRIALIRVGTSFPDDTTPAVQLHLGDHLGSSHIVLDDTGAFINREEYTPYGETSFGSFAAKRYRFTGKERDEESGLNYHSARYYAPWLARWVSPDPLGPLDGLNLYPYARNNPVRFTDLFGGSSDEDAKTTIKPKPTQPTPKPSQPPVTKPWIEADPNKALNPNDLTSPAITVPADQLPTSKNIKIPPPETPSTLVTLGLENDTKFRSAKTRPDGVPSRQSQECRRRQDHAKNPPDAKNPPS